MEPAVDEPVTGLLDGSTEGASTSDPGTAAPDRPSLPPLAPAPRATEACASVEAGSGARAYGAEMNGPVDGPRASCVEPSLDGIGADVSGMGSHYDESGTGFVLAVDDLALDLEGLDRELLRWAVFGGGATCMARKSRSSSRSRRAVCRSCIACRERRALIPVLR